MLPSGLLAPCRSTYKVDCDSTLYHPCTPTLFKPGKMWRTFTLLLLAPLATLAQTFEAELGVLNGVTIDNSTAGFTGTGYVTGFDAASDSVAITVQAPSYGVYTLSVRYRSPYGDKKASLLLNGAGAGEVALATTTTFANATAGKLLLQAGASIITIQDDWGYYDIDSITIAPAPLPPVASKYEAEDGIFSGGVSISTSGTGYSGTGTSLLSGLSFPTKQSLAGYVTGFANPGDTVSIIVNAPSYGVYDLTVLYRGPNGEKKTNLLINGSPSGEIDLPASANFTSTSAGKVLLNAGSNIIAFNDDWGWYDIDAITIALAPTPPPHKAHLHPVDPQASKEARSLLKFIQKKYGKKILSGQQDLQWIQWLKTNVGKEPAIGGFE